MANNASSFLPQLAGRLQRMVKFRITTHLDDFRRVSSTIVKAGA
jgi:hypothetical protein